MGRQPDRILARERPEWWDMSRDGRWGQGQLDNQVDVVL